ncbi:ABC transporter substrate-binding protein [Actinopolymorpha alba]|uniref:ABC transporter substrate-binding protein n=1 Tax=Actinopolymorpha alba TaxID=533267 RepID=UPI000368F15F|nr:ABC transporter substrate-binding protein [Actinopolymorpha alba]
MKNPQQLRASHLARRDMLKGGMGALVALSLAGCSFFETDAVKKGEGANPGKGAGASNAKEAPALAAKVKKGELPALEKRLPKTPMVVKPVERAGVYGGTWTSAMVTQEDYPWLENTAGYEPLVRWTPKYTHSPGTDEIMPNVAAAFEEQDGGSAFQFKLRDGLKWSDGAPCTIEDLRFTYEDFNVSEEVHPDGLYSLWTSPTSGRPAKFEKVDETTCRFVFEEPKPGFLNELASGIAMVLPMHYMKEFHKKYNPQVDDLVKTAGLNDWLQLFDARRDTWRNADLPTLNAWKVVTPIGEGSTVVAERNPYYWKVDADGRQLPYIDKLQSQILLDVEVEVLKIVNGELDMQMRNFGTVRNKPVIARNREKGGYRLVTIGPDGPNNMVIGFNQTHPDPKKRELYRNKDFRIGLSYAINRQKIIDSIYGGQGRPWQCAPLPDDAVADEELGTQYTEYSTAKANEYLDRAGFAEKDGQQRRLGPDNKPVTVIVLVNSEMPDQVDALELVRNDWNAVGVTMQIQRVAETLYWERVEANQAEVSTWTAGGFEVRATQGSNHYYVPTNTRGASRYGSTWAHWYVSKGKEGEEPPAPVKKQLELFDKMRATYDANEAIAFGKEILAITREQFYYIGISTPPESYGIVKNTFHNVPESMPGSVGYKPPGPTNPEQYFISE